MKKPLALLFGLALTLGLAPMFAGAHVIEHCEEVEDLGTLCVSMDDDGSTVIVADGDEGNPSPLNNWARATVEDGDAEVVCGDGDHDPDDEGRPCFEDYEPY